ncbi:MAG: hypothetical protein K9H64_15695 [Bacteroidales bacterium]|nr:hypothetical protein [Bacteroidales bacterium]MCF8457865.1 hypothetical protein [Bacteroidales bacterium]
MKKRKYLHHPSLFRVCLLILMMFSLLSNGDALAQKKSKKKKKTTDWDIEFSLGSSYDDNILKYSDKYLDRFMNHEDEGRFHIDTYDDIILQPAIGATYSFRLFGKQKSQLDANFKRSFYMVNDIKSWTYASFGFRHYLNKDLSFKLSYSHIPYFYIRHFRDDDWVDVFGYTQETFRPMAFSKDSYAFWIQNTFFENTRVKFSLSYMKYFYNSSFTEYDCDNMEYELKIYQPIHKKVKLVLGYQFTVSDAQAYDESFETKESSNDSDGSFEEDLFSVGFDWNMPRIFDRYNTLDVEAMVMKRYFSSTHYLEEDPTHAGRVDDNFRLYITYDIKLNKQLKLSVFYNWLYRESDTKAEANKEYLKNEKAYRQNQLGFKLAYDISL